MTKQLKAITWYVALGTRANFSKGSKEKQTTVLKIKALTKEDATTIVKQVLRDCRDILRVTKKGKKDELAGKTPKRVKRTRRT